MEYELGRNCHLFHSLMGNHPNEFSRLMRQKHGRDPDSEKFINFYRSGNSVEELEESLGLDVREIMCCISKTDPAVFYHRPYGLILSGEVKVMFDNDSGLSMMPDGTYPHESKYDFVRESDLQTLMTSWYSKFPESGQFIWNEAVLGKNSKIVGAFHDPSFDPNSMRCAGSCTLKEQEYPKFLEKVKRVGLRLREIAVKPK
ncbi:hypothetical protein HOA55_02895 [archaeon]|nr:hypothetical protein [archaeon]MBT3577480.1 hypothetical protein [archaeon]MBT6820277.1 hypothetical protein [archaeon]MBT6955917.1 hypothetical protein [archaeon]MBT7025091.1 hypothetical protein [archaeon]